MDQKLLTGANGITLCRVLLSFVLLFLSPLSFPFGAVYLLCGLSDMADGYIARKTHTESKLGARLDSAADLLFCAVSAIKLLPLMALPTFIWIWTAAIGAVKLDGMVRRFIRCGSFAPPHSIANRLTGLLLFLLPLTLPFADLCFSASLVCAAASFAAVQDIILIER